MKEKEKEKEKGKAYKETNHFADVRAKPHD